MHHIGRATLVESAATSGPHRPGTPDSRSARASHGCETRVERRELESAGRPAPLKARFGRSVAEKWAQSDALNDS